MELVFYRVCMTSLPANQVFARCFLLYWTIYGRVLPPIFNCALTAGCTKLGSVTSIKHLRKYFCIRTIPFVCDALENIAGTWWPFGVWECQNAG
ncbi:hypothetical protein J5N97_019146 [Dioscorea zingiberensis]|uniref:Uncharacterized protein n=1 Tax=Dioscorea zingiberensis TaxID=325984 RepID=A0A9D5CEG7_9LILI|nr:hypothetical protein J5N97_019146 [Dioscorea zingiberensis]